MISLFRKIGAVQRAAGLTTSKSSAVAVGRVVWQQGGFSTSAENELLWHLFPFEYKEQARLDELHKIHQIPSPPFPHLSLKEKWDLFRRWMIVYDKEYDSEEEMRHRFQIFKNRFEMIDEFARGQPEAEASQFGLSRHSDMTTEDFSESDEDDDDDVNKGITDAELEKS